MRSVIASFVFVGLVIGVNAYAQPTPAPAPVPTQQDYVISSYQQMLAVANDQLAVASAKLRMLEADVAKRKADDEAAAKTLPKEPKAQP